MDNTDWVKPYLQKIFSCDPNKDGDALQKEKLKIINKPFYKYCSVCENSYRTENTVDYNIENFLNDELFFQSPEKFNDPFDCFLGFSQIQTVRDVIIAEFKRQKKYTKQMQEAVKAFFSDNNFDIAEQEALLKAENILDIIDTVLPIFKQGDDSFGLDYIRDLFSTLLKQEDGKELFFKLVKNTLTVHDKQRIVDLMYENKKFIEYTKDKLTNENKDMIMEMAQRDFKFSIETTPNSFLSDNGESMFNSIDFFHMIINAMMPKPYLPEFADIKEKLIEASNEAMSKSREIIAKQCKITCFSECMNSPLMWSHYANKHYGFCLEYDFTYSMIKRYPDLIMAQIMLLPVVYSSERPLISQAFFNTKSMYYYMKNKTLPPSGIVNMIYGLLYKSEEWAYEREWRIILINSAKPTMKLPPARKVFLGVNIESESKARIIEIAKRKDIPVYQMVLIADKYKFDYYRVI